VAAAFEELYAATLDDTLEPLAHYYAQAEDRPKAVDYLERAAAAQESPHGASASGSACASAPGLL
jgi:hypothetical protein